MTWDMMTFDVMVEREITQVHVLTFCVAEAV